MRASASAGATGNFPIGADRRAGRPHLQLRLSRRGRGDACQVARLVQVRRDAESRKAAADDRRRRRVRAAGWRGARCACRQDRARIRRHQRRLERLLRPAHGRLARRPRSISVSCRAQGGKTAAEMATGRASTSSSPRRGRDRRRARAVRRLHRHAWRPRRASRRRHPARRRLSGKIRASTSTPKAGRSLPTARAFPPGDAREDWAILRALSDVLGASLPYDSLDAAAAGDVRGASASDAARPDRARQCGRFATSSPRSAARLTRRRCARRVADFYLTNPIARASAIMAECSALALGAARLCTAAE